MPLYVLPQRVTLPFSAQFAEWDGGIGQQPGPGVTRAPISIWTPVRLTRAATPGRASPQRSLERTPYMVRRQAMLAVLAGAALAVGAAVPALATPAAGAGGRPARPAATDPFAPGTGGPVVDWNKTLISI